MRANFIWKMLILTYTTFLIGLVSFELSSSIFDAKVTTEIEVNETKKTKPKLNKPKSSNKKPLILNEKPRWECFPADADLKYRKINYELEKITSKKELMKGKELKSLREKRDKLSKEWFRSQSNSKEKFKELESIDKKIQRLEQKYFYYNFDTPIENHTLLYVEECKEIK